MSFNKYRYLALGLLILPIAAKADTIIPLADVQAVSDQKVDFTCCNGATFKVFDLEVTWTGRIDRFSFRFNAALMCDTSISGQITKLLCKKEIEPGLPIEAEADATFVSAVWTGTGSQKTPATPVPETAVSIPLFVALGAAAAVRRIRRTCAAGKPSLAQAP